MFSIVYYSEKEKRIIHCDFQNSNTSNTFQFS